MHVTIKCTGQERTAVWPAPQDGGKCPRQQQERAIFGSSFKQHDRSPLPAPHSKENRPGFFRSRQQAQTVWRGLVARDGTNRFRHGSRCRRKVDFDFAVEAPFRFVANEYGHFLGVLGFPVFRQEKRFDRVQRFSRQHGVTEISCKPDAHRKKTVRGQSCLISERCSGPIFIRITHTSAIHREVAASRAQCGRSARSWQRPAKRSRTEDQSRSESTARQ